VTATPESATKRTRLTAEKRRAQILAAAREVFIEQGAAGARARLIAERAGITEAYLYRRFRSKEEIYELAIDAPLKALVEKLQVEIHELAARENISHTELLVRCHELFLECMGQVAPLLVATMFSDSGGGRDFYIKSLVPALRGVLELIITDISGRPVEAFDVDILVQAHLGVHLGLALESLLVDEDGVDIKDTARQVAALFADGIAATDGGGPPILTPSGSPQEHPRSERRRFG
jgi:TetR/AcrR family transcriptional regulator